MLAQILMLAVLGAEPVNATQRDYVGKTLPQIVAMVGRKPDVCDVSNDGEPEVSWYSWEYPSGEPILTIQFDRKKSQYVHRDKLLCAVPYREPVELPTAALKIPVAPPQVRFSPGDDCRAMAIAVIDGAVHDLRCQFYVLTDERVAQSLSDAAKRGVDVRVCLDKRMSKSKIETVLIHSMATAGVKVFTDGAHPIAHSKMLCADSNVVLIGSWNASHQSKHNLENVLRLESADVAKIYLENWDSHRQHCEAAK